MATTDAIVANYQLTQLKKKLETAKKNLEFYTAQVNRGKATMAKWILEWEKYHGEGNTDYNDIYQGYIDEGKKQADDNRPLQQRYQKEVKELTDKINSLTNTYAAKYAPKKDDVPPANQQQTKLSTTTARGGYTFNAPMIKNSSFATTTAPSGTLQQLIARGYNISEGNKDDAIYFWKNGQGGRGAIQMDRQSYTPANLEANRGQFSNPDTFDDTLYGYKFHYNPSAVTMTWGAVDGVDPYFAASDNNPSVPVAQNLLQSYIDFAFYINRIEDFNYLDYNGYKNLDFEFKSDYYMDPAERNARYKEAYLKAIPYPETVGLDDLKSIYLKGTMYDVDWLMKVMHGGTGFVNYKSSLMGITSDIGWLPYRVLELHLGASMRYRARVASLKVDHIIFNSRMVPVLSKVTLTMARYYDGPRTGKTAS